jgi:hypothetical protein
MNNLLNLKYNDEEREIFIEYFYSLKENYDNIETFLQSVNSNDDININFSEFEEYSSGSISQKDLNRFFENSKINENIENIKYHEEDWYYTIALLETKSYYIVRIWETTA